MPVQPLTLLRPQTCTNDEILDNTGVRIPRTLIKYRSEITFLRGLKSTVFLRKVL
mgnify:CR=1 FL=1